MDSAKVATVVRGLFDPERIIAERQWQQLSEGVRISVIYQNGDDGPSAALLHYQPGATVAEHLHLGYEHIVILHGEQSDDFNRCPAGTLLIHPPGSRHQVRSEGGCIALGFWQRPVKFI